MARPIIIIIKHISDVSFTLFVVNYSVFAIYWLNRQPAIMLKASKCSSSTKSSQKTKPTSSYFQAGVFKDRSSSKKVKLSHDNNDNGLTPPVTKLNKTNMNSEQANAHHTTLTKDSLCQPCGTKSDTQLLIETHQPFHPGPSYKFPKRKVSGANRGCTTRSFQKCPMMTCNECDDSVTCMISEKSMEDENFIKTCKHDHDEFS